LNWHLTLGERKEIHDKAYDSYTAAAIDNAKDWIRSMRERRRSSVDLPRRTSAGGNEPCRIAYVRLKPLVTSPGPTSSVASR
jgi:hypothetical protein